MQGSIILEFDATTTLFQELFIFFKKFTKREENKMKKNVLKLTETAIMIALGTVLSLFTIANLPFGGSVTVCSMVPVALIAYRYKLKWGLLAGTVYGLVQMILGASNLAYGTSALAVVLIILFDYIVAFGVIGFAGLFRDRLNGNQALEVSIGALLACVLRYVCHFISGWAVWGAWAEDMPAWLYSITYNATYMIPETIVTVVACVLLGLVLDFRKDTVSPLKRNKA